MTKKDKVEKVMGEWKAGTLTSHGKKVTNYDQAVAIALSEAGLSKKYNEGGSIEKENALMVANNNKQIAHHTREMESALKDTNYVPAWVVAKVNRSASDLSDATHYLEGQEGKYEKGGNMNKYAKGGAVDAPKIYVADLEAYNNGKLVGEWLDLSDFEDGKDVSKEISKLLKKWGAEEYAIHDVENVPSSIYSEYMGEEDFDKIIKIYKASEESDLPYEVISEIMLQYEPEDLEEWISDYYEGHFDNDTDLAYNVVESIGGVSDLGKKTTEMYFDYEKFGRDLAINDYIEIEDGYYFRTPRYAKGGLTNERRYVNKSQDYEVRYAKNRLKRTGYKNERKFAVGGEIGNTVSFKGNYGTPRSGVIKEKRGSSYIVSTDDGDRLVDSYEVISFSEAPIAKKKLFGFFEGGGSIEEYKQAERDYDKYGEYLEDAIEDENEADIKKYKKLMDEAETKMHRYERKYAGGGEIENKIEKLKKVVSSKMLPESVKAKAQAEIDKLEKELENKMTGESEGERNVGMDEEKDYVEAKTKALEKSLKDKTISETQRKRDEKELALFKGAGKSEAKKPTTRKEKVSPEDIRHKLKEGYSYSWTSAEIGEPNKIELFGFTIYDENGKDVFKSSMIYDDLKQVKLAVNNRLSKIIPTHSKPTTRKAPVKKAPVKKAVAKKVEVKSKVVGDDLKVIKFFDLTESDWNKMALNERNKLSESYKEKNKAPKADHKKLVAKLKAKKGGKEYDNRASLVPFTDKRRERSESSDKKRSALPPGKRVSENGVTYYENRLNRTDLSKKDKFEKGGEVKGSDWSLNLNW